MQTSAVVAPGLQSTGSIVMACRLSCPRDVGPSWTRKWTRVSCMGWRILYHWATREDPRAILLFKYKMGPKAAEAACNINNAFGPELVTNIQWCFKKFCKGDKTWDNVYSGQQLEVDNDQLRAIIKADPLTTTWEVAKELKVDHSIIIRHFNRTGKMNRPDKIKKKKKERKGLVSGASWANQKKKKNSLLKCLFLFYTTTTNQFSIRLWHETKSGFYTTTGDNQLSGWTKTMLQSTFQSQTCTRKRSQGHCLVICCSLIHSSFLNPGETITPEKYGQ